jgi:hypothetical protein
MVPRTMGFDDCHARPEHVGDVPGPRSLSLQRREKKERRLACPASPRILFSTSPGIPAAGNTRSSPKTLALGGTCGLCKDVGLSPGLGPTPVSFLSVRARVDASSSRVRFVLEGRESPLCGFGGAARDQVLDPRASPMVGTRQRAMAILDGTRSSLHRCPSASTALSELPLAAMGFSLIASICRRGRLGRVEWRFPRHACHCRRLRTVR